VTEDEGGLRLDRWIRRHFPALTNGQVQKWIRTGQIRLDGKRTSAESRLKAGQQLRLPPFALQPPAAGAFNHDKRKAARLKKLILFEDEDVIVLNKPAGLAVQGGSGLKENLDDELMLLSLDGKTRPKLVHRLDRETSGVLLIARNAFAAARLAASFRHHDTIKLYWALTAGVPKPRRGLIEAPLFKQGHKMRVGGGPNAKDAATLYHVMDHAGKNMACVLLRPLTGRTHQLRAHLAHKGTPIWGDPLYGAPQENDLDMGKGLHLHARRIIIPHPRRGMIDITAPLDQEMKKSWQALGFSEDKGDLTSIPAP